MGSHPTKKTTAPKVPIRIFSSVELRAQIKPFAKYESEEKKEKTRKKRFLFLFFKPAIRDPKDEISACAT